MLNLLTDADKRTARFLYAGRVLMAFFIVSIAVSVLGAAFLLPSYFLIQSRMSAEKEQLALLEHSIAAKSDEANNPVLAGARRKLVTLSETTKRTPIHSFFETIIGTRVAPVHITGLSYDAAESGGGMVRINGIADAREPLTRFVKTLAREGSFTSVDLPVSDLAANADIGFSVSARGAF
jgi:Tfp pilus assembly protein PilN